LGRKGSERREQGSALVPLTVVQMLQQNKTTSISFACICHSHRLEVVCNCAGAFDGAVHYYPAVGVVLKCVRDLVNAAGGENATKKRQKIDLSSATSRIGQTMCMCVIELTAIFLTLTKHWPNPRYYIPTSCEVQHIESVSRSPIYLRFWEALLGVATVRATERSEEHFALLP